MPKDDGKNLILKLKAFTQDVGIPKNMDIHQIMKCGKTQ